jgi:hypothetical protein
MPINEEWFARERRFTRMLGALFLLAVAGVIFLALELRRPGRPEPHLFPLLVGDAAIAVGCGWLWAVRAWRESDGGETYRAVAEMNRGIVPTLLLLIAGFAFILIRRILGGP